MLNFISLWDKDKKYRWHTFSAIFIICLSIVLYFNWQSGWAGDVSNFAPQCIRNLGKIGDALENYKKTNNVFPATLNELKPYYLSEIPKCYGHDYSAKSIEYYKKLYGIDISGYKYEVSDNRQTFTVYCPGYNHEIVSEGLNSPMYSSDTGLIVRSGEPLKREGRPYW
jgi:hypothetical protein